jgi:ribosome-associated heat shock protein Hsp15
MQAAPEVVGQRLDKWLWFVRVAKSRTLAAALVSGGKVRVNRTKTDKPSHWLKPGDVVTVTTGPRVRVLRVVAAGERRGPATEARGLFEELTPAVEGLKPAADKAGSAGVAVAPANRPDKRDRREIVRLKGKMSWES